VDSDDERSTVKPLATFDKYDALLPVVAVFVRDVGDHFVGEYDFVVSAADNNDVGLLDMLDK
jgi:hypothetical protein